MAIVGSTLLVDKTRTGMRPHPILTVNADQDEIAWGAVTLAYLYRQLGMASRAGCKTIAGCLTLLIFTWKKLEIYLPIGKLLLGTTLHRHWFF